MKRIVLVVSIMALIAVVGIGFVQSNSATDPLIHKATPTSASLAATTATPSPTSSTAANDTSCHFAAGPHLILPLYSYTEYADVSAIIASYPALQIVVVNIDTGPGASYSSYYGRAIAQLSASGLCVVGLVPTYHASVPITEVEANITMWYSYYGDQGLRGIWLDEGGKTVDSLSYYQTLHSYIKALGGYDIVNPGSYPAQQLLGAADLTIVNESDESTFLQTTPPAWALLADPSTMGTYILDVPDAASMQSDLALAIRNHADWVFITDRALEKSQQPYMSLPSYWSQELDAAASDG